MRQLGVSAMPDLSRLADETARLLGLASGASHYASEIAAPRADQIGRSSVARAAWVGMQQMTIAAEHLWAAFAVDPERLARLGPEIAAIAPLEMYGAARAYDILVEDAE